jgi:parallel beta-helix repeat protein
MSGGGRFKIMDSEMKTEGDHPHCKGPLFNLTTSDYADEKRSVVYIEDTIVDNCQEGIGFTGTAEGVLRRNTVTNCARRGVLVTKNSKISMTGNVIRYNGGELSSEKGFGGVAAWDNDNELFSPQMDLGGGSIEIDGKTMTSDGFNIICGNLYKSAWPLKWDIHNLSESDQTAENNWWCNTDPSDIGDNQIWEINGSVDYLPIVRRQPWWMPTYTTQATCEAAAGNWGASASSCTWE